MRPQEVLRRKGELQVTVSALQGDDCGDAANELVRHLLAGTKHRGKRPQNSRDRRQVEGLQVSIQQHRPGKEEIADKPTAIGVGKIVVQVAEDLQARLLHTIQSGPLGDKEEPPRLTIISEGKTIAKMMDVGNIKCEYSIHFFPFFSYFSSNSSLQYCSSLLIIVLFDSPT